MPRPIAIAVVLTAGFCSCSWMLACAGRGEIVLDPGDLAEASSAPKIDAVSELGGGDVVLTADLPVPGPGDGSATIGEVLWVRGSSFGRLPTVNVAGRPGVVLARTNDGGLVTRVPPGAPAGPQKLTVINDHGSGDFPITVRRLVVAIPPAAGRLSTASLAADGPRAAGTVQSAGSMLQVGADGRAAYVLDPATGRLVAFELPAQTQPRGTVLQEGEGKPTGDPVLAFAAAAHAPTLLIARAREVLVLDATSALRPIRSRPRPLPAEIVKAAVARVALAPDGRAIAVATEDNRVWLVSVAQPGAAELRASLAVAPGARVPVIADLTFAPDGRTIWVALGDTAKSQAVGVQPTEIVAVRVQMQMDAGSPATLAEARRVTVGEARRPIRLSAGRARPLQSGASIRLPPERATVYLTAFRDAGPAAVFRVGVEDQATIVLEAPAGASLGGAELSPDGVWLMAPTSAGGDLGLLTIAADGRTDAKPERTRLDLGVGPRAPKGPEDVPSLAVQP